LLGIPLAILLFVGLLGTGDKGIFAHAGFFSAIYVTLKLLGVFFIAPMMLGLLLVCIPTR
jgi:hypothetical protein